MTSAAAVPARRRMTVFTRSRWGIGLATALGLTAMLLYPGGTPLDPATRGYSIFRNFLSDLGMTVSFGGQSNRLGAALFVVSLLTLIVTLGSGMFAFITLYSRTPRARRLAVPAGLIGMIVCVSFAGVAVTPENRVMNLHVAFTLLAFQLIPLVPLLIAVAAAVDGTVPRRVTVVWALLAIVLGVYAAVLEWGPLVATPSGLLVQVIAQKIAVITILGAIVYQSLEADRTQNRS